MFETNTLPPITSFGRDRIIPCSTLEYARSYPRGGCQYQHAHQISPCACQTFQHDRNAPGNLCDCGHSACYHSDTTGVAKSTSDHVVKGLAEKIRTLEEAVIRERLIRDDMIVRERQICEQEIRKLKATLALTHNGEAEMKRKMSNLEDKIEDIYHKQHRLKDSVRTISDAEVALERRFEHYDTSSARKRKASRSPSTADVILPNLPETPLHSDASILSPHMSPQAPSLAGSERKHPIYVTSPRSSGILKLYAGRTTRRVASTTFPAKDGDDEQEPRSSGFLSINVTTDNSQRGHNYPPTVRTTGRTTGRTTSTMPHYASTGRHTTTSLYGLPSPPATTRSKVMSMSTLLTPGDPSKVGSLHHEYSPKRKKQHDFVALDILANASVASS